MREPRSTTLAGHEYQVEPLPGMKGFLLLTLLGRLLAPALAEASSLASLAAGGAGAAGRGGLGAIASLLLDLREADAERLLREFAAATRVEAAPGARKFVLLKDVFDVHFAANYGAMRAWLAFCVEVNYGDFFAELLARAGAAPGASAPTAAAPATAAPAGTA